MAKTTLRPWMLGALVMLGGCQNQGGLAPIRTAENVDLARFMGDWYVVASIPTFIEKHAWNAVETYELGENGRIPTTFRFNDGSADGPVKTYHPTGFVEPGTDNAVWGMQVIWPIKAEYRILYVSDDYTMTVIGRSKRDYVWIMARTPHISEATYAELVEMIRAEGYDIDQLRRVPHDDVSVVPVG